VKEPFEGDLEDWKTRLILTSAKSRCWFEGDLEDWLRRKPRSQFIAPGLAPQPILELNENTLLKLSLSGL